MSTPLMWSTYMVNSYKSLPQFLPVSKYTGVTGDNSRHLSLCVHSCVFVCLHVHICLITMEKSYTMRHVKNWNNAVKENIVLKG